jgi:hypothetical protein
MKLAWVPSKIFCSVYNNDDYLLFYVRNIKDKLVAAVIFFC